MPEAIVVDASAVVDLLSETQRSLAVIDNLAGRALHAPAHLDAEVLASLVRMERQGRLIDVDLTDAVRTLAALRATRHPLDSLLLGASSRRANVGVADGLYIELAHQLNCPLVTCDAGQAVNYGLTVLVT